MAEREQYQGQPAEGFKSLEEWGKVDAFSSEELEAWKRSPVSRLESRVIATIARLQTALEEAEAGATDAHAYWEHLIGQERDGAEARDRLRGKALGLFRMGKSGHFFGCGVLHKLDKGCSPACAAARAAIDIKLEEAREKEGR